jgi:gluconolactonase
MVQRPITYPNIGQIVRKDSRMDQLMQKDARIEVLASGFDWLEDQSGSKMAPIFFFRMHPAI